MWRIATDAPDCEADDLSGEGAKRTGGRWNEKGAAVVYASENRALACLETMVHLNAGGLPLNRYLVAVTIPDDVWTKARRESAPGIRSQRSASHDARTLRRVNRILRQQAAYRLSEKVDTGLVVGWDAEPAGRASIGFGMEWLRSGDTALLVVPSVIVPEEFNVLINPQHPASSGITATKVRRWLYDLRPTRAG